MPVAPYFHWTICSKAMTKTVETRARTGMVFPPSGSSGGSGGAGSVETNFHQPGEVGNQLSLCCPHLATTYKQVSNNSL
ncbi:hypothetical protein SVIOM342S_04433 [Streptomyces violaceorubidus]